MFNILDLLHKGKKGIKVFNTRLQAGEIVNIYGDPYVGKTTAVIYILGQNFEEPFLYFQTEFFDNNYKEALLKKNKRVFASKLTDIKLILSAIKSMEINVVIDSLNGIQYNEDNEKILSEIFEYIVQQDLNMVVISQVKGYEHEEWYDCKRVVDFYSYKLKVEKKGDYFVLNKNVVKSFKEIWE